MLLKFGDERIKVYSLFKKGKRSICYWIEGLKREKKTQVYCKAKERDKRKKKINAFQDMRQLSSIEMIYH